MGKHRFDFNNCGAIYYYPPPQPRLRLRFFSLTQEGAGVANRLRASSIGREISTMASANMVPALSTLCRRLNSFIAHNPVVSMASEARPGDILVGTHSGSFHCDEVGPPSWSPLSLSDALARCCRFLAAHFYRLYPNITKSPSFARAIQTNCLK